MWRQTCEQPAVWRCAPSVLQVFYWSHLSYVWVWILLVIHCANFWKWFVVPGLVFVLEKIVGIAVSRMGGLYIVEVNLLPSKVPNTNTDWRPRAVCYRVTDDTTSLVGPFREVSISSVIGPREISSLRSHLVTEDGRVGVYSPIWCADEVLL